MNARARQKRQTRSRILTQATRLAMRRGVAAVRTAEVAKAAKVSHGAIFVHFPSRDDLINEVAFAWGRQVTDQLHAAWHEGADLATALTTHVDCIRDHEDLYRGFLEALPSLPADARASWLGIQSAVAEHLWAVAEREQTEGIMRPMARHLLFNTWVGLLHHYIQNRRLFAPKGSVLEAKGQELVDHFIQLTRA